MTIGEIILLIVELVIGGILVWWLRASRSIWGDTKELMQQQIELAHAQTPSAQELAAQVQIIKEAAQAEKRRLDRQLSDELERRLSDRDESHRKELEEKQAQIAALEQQISEYEHADRQWREAEEEVLRHARNVLAHSGQYVPFSMTYLLDKLTEANHAQRRTSAQDN